MEYKIAALLPIKANSERVKGKNFREFNGKPLFQWVLDSLLKVDEIDVVVVNTDARPILAENGLVDSKRVKIRDRKSKLCGDHISMNLILGDDVDNVDADMYLMTHATNPLLSPRTIRKAINAFKKAKAREKADSLFSVNKIQTRFYRSDGSAVNHDPSNLLRTQDLEPWFEENSNLYIFTRDSFNATRARIGKKPMLFEMSRIESTDIDDEEDWKFAVIAAKYLEVS